VRPLLARALTGGAAAVVSIDLAVGLYARSSGASQDSAWMWLGPAAGVFCVVAGWLVIRHDPTNPVGPAVAWTSAAVSATAVLETVSASAYTSSPLPLAEVLKPWWNSFWPLQLAGVFALLLVFPDGRRPGPLWRSTPWVFVAACACVAAGMHGSRRAGNDIVGGLSAVLTSVGVLLLAVSLVLAVASLSGRYIHGSPRTRLQVRWLLLVGVAVVALLVYGWVARSFGAPLDVAFLPFLVAVVVLVPTAVAVAVIRYDLFDVDRLLSASASWFVTLTLSAVVFGAVVVGVSQILHDVTGVGSTAAAFVTALVILPLHRGVNETVGRVVDRDRFIRVAAVDRFAADVRAGRREPEEIEQVLREAQEDPQLRLLLAYPEGGWVNLDGTPATAEGSFTLETRGDPIARVVLGWESARARRRVAALVKAAWVPIEVSRLRLVLREALAEARSSRARLAEASAAERRYLERTLHDGAQQRLIATGMRLRLVQRDLEPPHATEVDLAVAELQDTVDELRRLAHGVRPSRLDDGLEAALAAVRDATPLPFDLEVDALPPLDDTLALTAYLVVSEAVTNALKHARASRIEVRVADQGGRLAVEVADDGIGGVDANEPMTALRDRVLSVGGRLRVSSPAGRGTTIRAIL
jgi:signal transduction histidine kinase